MLDTDSIRYPIRIRVSECRRGDHIEFQGWPLIVADRIQDGDFRGVFAVDENARDEDGDVGTEVPDSAEVLLYYRRERGAA